MSAPSSELLSAVVIGGSFAGLTAARQLIHSNKFHVHIIEPRAYFEYNPSILRAIVDEATLNDILIPFDEMLIFKQNPNTVTHHAAIATAIDMDLRQVELNNGQSVHYDYLIIAVGSNYANDIKSVIDKDWSVAARKQTIGTVRSKVEAAKKITVFGAGYVGIELIAELAEFCHPEQQLTLRVKRQTLLPRLPITAQQFANDFLARFPNVEIIFSCNVQPGDYECAEDEIVFDCSGNKRRAMPTLRSQQYNNDWTSFMDPSGNATVLVNRYLQLSSDNSADLPFDPAQRIYLVGDIASHYTAHDKMAYSAEWMGEVAAENVIQHASSDCSHMHAYPESLCKSQELVTLLDCSLGKNSGIVLFNDVVTRGKIGAIMKHTIQSTKCSQYRGEAYGKWFWKLNDAFIFYSNWIYRSFKRRFSATTQAKGVAQEAPNCIDDPM